MVTMTAPSTLRCLAGCGPRRYLVAGPTWNPAFRWYGSRSRLEPQDGRTGRRCVFCYDPEDDPAGELALDAGADYYNEAMSCDWRTERRRRVECFQAAEVLYLHASRLGNAMADDDLTYVYSYDRCEGNYWDSVAAGAKSPRPEERLSIAERAFAHCRVAAESGIAESCYKLGDFLRDGRGCEKDAPCRRQSARARALPA